MAKLQRKTVARLLNKEEKTIGEIASLLGTDYFSIRNFIIKKKIPILVPKSGRRIDPAKMAEARRLLLETNLGILEISKRLGFRSRSSIYCLRDRLQREQEKESVVEEGSGGLTFKTLTEKKKCPTHGAVSVWPCVMCEANRYRQENRLKYVAQSG